jgi:hypothetical protein
MPRAAAKPVATPVSKMPRRDMRLLVVVIMYLFVSKVKSSQRSFSEYTWAEHRWICLAQLNNLSSHEFGKQPG